MALSNGGNHYRFGAHPLLEDSAAVELLTEINCSRHEPIFEMRSFHLNFI